MFIGIDACKGGWILAIRQQESWTIRFTELLEDEKDLLCQAGVILVDMPVGVPSGAEGEGKRECDRALRSFLQYRKSSVFSPPIREVLQKESYQEALEVQRSIVGRGFSVQSWNIVPRIVELEKLLLQYPEIELRLWESHPELCFQQLFGPDTIQSSKHTAAGQQMRLDSLETLVALKDLDLRAHYLFKKAGTRKDVLDAVVLALCAFFTGKDRGSLFLPAVECRDVKGLRMQVRCVESAPIK